jgi:hypothetical protein
MPRRTGGSSATVELENAVLEGYAAVTKAWTGIALGEEDPLPCTPDNALKLYRRFTWIADAVGKFVGDRANFLSRSANGSAPPSAMASN